MTRTEVEGMGLTFLQQRYASGVESPRCFRCWVFLYIAVLHDNNQWQEDNLRRSLLACTYAILNGIHLCIAAVVHVATTFLPQFVCSFSFLENKVERGYEISYLGG